MSIELSSEQAANIISPSFLPWPGLHCTVLMVRVAHWCLGRLLSNSITWPLLSTTQISPVSNPNNISPRGDISTAVTELWNVLEHASLQATLPSLLSSSHTFSFLSLETVAKEEESPNQAQSQMILEWALEVEVVRREWEGISHTAQSRSRDTVTRYRLSGENFILNRAWGLVSRDTVTRYRLSGENFILNRAWGLV